GGGEDRVRARDVRAEHDVGRRLVRRGDRGQVDDRVDAGQYLGAAERLERLAEVGEVGGQERGGILARRDEVDVEDLVPVLEQVAHHGAPGLAAPSGDGDLHARVISDVRTPAIGIDRLRNRRSYLSGDIEPDSPSDWTAMRPVLLLTPACPRHAD